MCRLSHSRRKGHCLTPKRSLDWWCNAPFFCGYAKRCFYEFSDDFLFSCPFVPEAERMPSVSACPMNEASGHTQPDKPGRKTVSTRLDKYSRIGNCHTSLLMVCPFHASGDVFFFQSVLLFYGFSLKFLYSNLPLFSFTSILRLSVESHQAVIFVLGAKVIPGLDGKARSSLLFSVKISSPAGSILTGKPCIP